ncbi:MAG TPA: hypothetical protein VFR87_00930 [Nocardioidaceae bacterium]|nr:hypothetical protein [Nocardioidaceae bacterium]
MSKQATETHEDRPHVSDLVAGLLEARLTHVHFLDTVAGAELHRLYMKQQERRHRDSAKQRPTAAS